VDRQLGRLNPLGNRLGGHMPNHGIFLRPRLILKRRLSQHHEMPVSARHIALALAECHNRPVLENPIALNNALVALMERQLSRTNRRD
jgi:hypothetical protein